MHDSMTVDEYFQLCDETCAAILKIQHHDEDDKTLRMAVFVTGKVECGEVLAALEKIEEAWDAAPTAGGQNDGA